MSAVEYITRSAEETIELGRKLAPKLRELRMVILHGDLGTSSQFHAPVSSFLFPALWRSLKLAAVAFVIVVPLSILGGVIAALYRGRFVEIL